MDELAQPSRDEAEQRLELELAGERVADLVQRLELAQPAGRRLVEPRVLDRDRGLGGEQLRQLLVLLGERPAALLLGQVQVPVGDAAKQDRHAEEGLHRRVVRRETRPSAGRRRGRRAAAACASRISTPRIPRPRGRSPIAACVSASMPVVDEALERLPRSGRSRRAPRSARRSAARPSRRAAAEARRARAPS